MLLMFTCHRKSLSWKNNNSILEKYFQLQWIFLIVFLGFACDDKKEKNPEPEIIISVLPDIGTTETVFEFTVENIIIDDDTIKDYSTFQVRWDLDNDGIWETGWLDTFSIFNSYNAQGKQVIRTELLDQNEIIYTATYGVFVREIIQITENTSTSSQMNPDWCPDGSNRIAFEWRPESDEHRIYVIQYPNGTPEPVTSEPAHFSEWSPDGEFILFERNRGQWVVNIVTGTEEELIAQEYHVVSKPRWSPDGSRIVFKGVCNDEESICVYDVNDSSYSSLIADNNYRYFCWSPANDLIAASGGTNLDIYNSYSGSLLSSFSLLNIGSKIDWSPDGNWISLGFFQGEILYLINVNNGRILTLKPDGIEYPWYAGWSSDGSSIAFEGKHENASQLTIWAITFPDDI